MVSVTEYQLNRYAEFSDKYEHEKAEFAHINGKLETGEISIDKTLH